MLDVLNIPGNQRSLERLADLLGKVQKALGEYLERERASFPRFVRIRKIYIVLASNLRKNTQVENDLESKLKIESCSYLQHYAVVCDEWRGSSTRLCA